MIYLMILTALAFFGQVTSRALDTGLSTHLQSPPKHWDISQPLNGVSFARAKPISSPSLDALSTYSSRLRPLRGRSSRRSSITAVSRLHSASTNPSWNASVSPVSVVGGYSTEYAVECTWDGTPIWLLFDTGSSDTWAPNKKLNCLTSTGTVEDPEICGIGPVRIGKFSGGLVDEVHIFVKYGSGETVSGPMGYAEVSCGGVPVHKQQVGLVNSTYWHGNNITSGILGLAYPSITSGFYGQVGEEAIWNTAPYTPWFTNAVKQGAVAPVFSVALERNSTDGVLAWGGLPPKVDWQPGSMVSTDLIIANIAGVQQTAWDYSFYTIIPDGMRWGEMYDTTKYPFIVDTGSTMIYLPPPLAETIAMSFEPRATYLYQWGAYYAPCDSVPPIFGVVIEGKTFYVRPQDLIFQDVVDPATGFCAVALTTGGMGPYILGDVFLQSVVAVFDIGGAEMRFYSRYYSD